MDIYIYVSLLNHFIDTRNVHSLFKGANSLAFQCYMICFIHLNFGVKWGIANQMPLGPPLHFDIPLN